MKKKTTHKINRVSFVCILHIKQLWMKSGEGQQREKLERIIFKPSKI